MFEKELNKMLLSNTYSASNIIYESFKRKVLLTKGFSIFYNSLKLHCMLANLETYRKKNILQSLEQQTVKRVISAEQGCKFKANENVREKMRNFDFVFCNVFLRQ